MGYILCCVNGHRAFICHYLTHGRRCTCVTHNSKQLNSALGRAVTVHTGNIELYSCKKAWIIFEIPLTTDESVLAPMFPSKLRMYAKNSKMCCSNAVCTAFFLGPQKENFQKMSPSCLLNKKT